MKQIYSVFYTHDVSKRIYNFVLKLPLKNLLIITAALFYFGCTEKQDSKNAEKTKRISMSGGIDRYPEN